MKLQRSDIQSKVTRISIETRALLLGQFPTHSDEYLHQGEFSSICNSCRELLELFFFDLYVHAQISLYLLVMGISC
jgi:hypothetical protein